MCDNRGTTASDILGHPDMAVLDLIGSRFAAQLLNDFDNLIHPGSTNRMSASFQTAHRGYWDTSVKPNLPLLGKAHTLSARGKSACFEFESGHNRKRIVGLEQIEVLRGNAGQ